MTATHGPSADNRRCELCGTVFVPRREHARFCCVLCRVAWNREHTGDPALELRALQWSITAMSETKQLLHVMTACNKPQAFALIGEAVWWVTIVDATLVRYHSEPYDAMLAAQAPAGRRRIEETLAGLRFVRNRIGEDAGLAEFIGSTSPAAGSARMTDWRWKQVQEPAFASLGPRARAWEISRYRAYRAQLAGRTIAETFGRATEFLALGTVLAAHGQPATPCSTPFA